MSEPQQIEMFPTELHLQRIDPERNVRRFYYLTLQPTLFGTVDLTCEWGRIGSSGQIYRLPHKDTGQAINALRSIATRRKKRGYRE